MRYIDDINNIRPIYINFCEYILSKSTPEKEKLIERMLLLNRDQFDDVYNTRTRFRAYMRDTQSITLFRDFIRAYIALNPRLVLYKEQLINIEFNPALFREELEELNNNISCLK